MSKFKTLIIYLFQLIHTINRMSQTSHKNSIHTPPLKKSQMKKTKTIRKVFITIIKKPPGESLEGQVQNAFPPKQLRLNQRTQINQRTFVTLTSTKPQLQPKRQEEIHEAMHESPPKLQKIQDGCLNQNKSHRKQYLKVLHSRAEKDFPRRVHQKILQFMHNLTPQPCELIQKFLQFFNQRHNIKEQYIQQGNRNITLKAIFILDCIIIKNSKHCPTLQFAINDLMQKSKKIQQNKKITLQRKIMSLDQEEREKIIQSKKDFHQKSSEIRDIYHNICLKIIKAEHISLEEIDGYVDQVVCMKTGDTQDGIKEVKGLRIIQERKRRESKEFIRFVLDQLQISMPQMPIPEVINVSKITENTEIKEQQQKCQEQINDHQKEQQIQSLKMLDQNLDNIKRPIHQIDEDYQIQKSSKHQELELRVKQIHQKSDFLEQNQKQRYCQSQILKKITDEELQKWQNQLLNIRMEQEKMKNQQQKLRIDNGQLKKQSERIRIELQKFKKQIDQLLFESKMEKYRFQERPYQQQKIKLNPKKMKEYFVNFGIMRSNEVIDSNDD